MVMRYHWGLAVGHIYSHHPSNENPISPRSADAEDALGDGFTGGSNEVGPEIDDDSTDGSAGASDFVKEDSSDGSEEGSSHSGDSGSENTEADSVALEEMYGVQDNDMYDL
jgi:hypothetical protein